MLERNRIISLEEYSCCHIFVKCPKINVPISTTVVDGRNPLNISNISTDLGAIVVQVLIMNVKKILL